MFHDRLFRSSTFTQIALQLFLKDANLTEPLKAFPSVYSLFQALKSKDVEKIFVPIENSFGGDVYAANEGLLNLDKDFSITQEVMLTIQQSLMSNRLCTLSEITKIYAHEQSVRQCELFATTVAKYSCNCMFIKCTSS